MRTGNSPGGAAVSGSNERSLRAHALTFDTGFSGNLKQNRFSVVREFVGHGIGRELHEEPQIPNFGQAGYGPVLKEGMVLAIEPMVNAGKRELRIREDHWTAVTADGEYSAHFEHMVAVTRDGPDVLTRL